MTGTAAGRAGAASSRRRRSVVAGLGLLALGAALLAAAEWAGWPFLRGPLQQAMSRASGVPVALDGGFRLHLLGSPRLQVGHLDIGAAGAAIAPYLLRAEGVALHWRWSDVRRWQDGAPLRLRRVDADSVDAQLVRRADGSASWQIGAPAKAAAGAPAPWPVVEWLEVRDGRIAIDDAVTKTQLAVQVRGSEAAASAAGGPPVAAGGLVIDAKGHYQRHAVRLRAEAAAALPLVDTTGSAPPVALRAQGSVGRASFTFDGRAAALLGARPLDGSFSLRGPSLAAVGDPLGITLPTTPPFQMSGHVGHLNGVWALHTPNARIGSSRFAGTLRLDTRPAVPLLAGSVTAQRVAGADLGPVVGADAVPAAAGDKARVLPDRAFDLPSLSAMDADVDLVVDELDFGTDALAPWRALRTRVHLAGGVLKLQDFEATIAGGRFSGALQLDGRTPPARMSADMKVAGLDVAGWVRSLRKASAAPAPRSASGQRSERSQARAASTPVVSYLTGALSGAAQVKGQGRSAAEILGTLDGQARLELRDGTLSHLATELIGLDVAQALGVALRGDQPLPLRCGILDLALHQGVASTRMGVLDNRDSTVLVSGTISLRDETLALTVTARPKDISPLALRSPLHVTGSFANPKVSIVSAGLIGRLAAAIALGAAAGPAALLPFVDVGKAPANDPCLPVARAASAAGAPASQPAPARRPTAGTGKR